MELEAVPRRLAARSGPRQEMSSIYLCLAHYPGSNGPGSEKPSIDSTFALFSAMLSGVRCGS